MPELDGFAATREIRRREADTGRRTLVIGLTALAMERDRQRGLECGMDDYLTRPISVNVLSEKLLYHLNRRGLGSGVMRAIPVDLVT